MGPQPDTELKSTKVRRDDTAKYWAGLACDQSTQLPGDLTTKTTAPDVGAVVTLDALEQAHIRRILAATQSLEEAAEVLGIDAATLYRRRKRFGI